MLSAFLFFLTPIVLILTILPRGIPSKQKSNVSFSAQLSVGMTFIPCF